VVVLDPALWVHLVLLFLRPRLVLAGGTAR
jgi:hypothetical protein